AARRGAVGAGAVAFWTTLPTDAEAAFDRELTFDATKLAPMVTWGTSPEDCSPVDGAVPDPSAIGDADRRRHVERALDYMRLTPATPLEQVAIDRVFIGSCAHSGIEDLRAAAAVLEGRRAVVPGMVSPGSSAVKRQAEAEGLDRIFLAAGLEWRDSGCSMCNGSNGEIVAPGERCASTTNRNFEGRQGRGALTHIMSPAMVAAAAVFGRIADVRRLSPDCYEGPRRNAAVGRPHRRRRSARDRKDRHRHDPAGPVHAPASAARARLFGSLSLRLALRRRRQAARRFRAEPASLS